MHDTLVPYRLSSNVRNFNNLSVNIGYLTVHVNIPIHLFLPVKMGVDICTFYGSGFWFHPRPAIFSSAVHFAA